MTKSDIHFLKTALFRKYNPFEIVCKLDRSVWGCDNHFFVMGILGIQTK